MPALSEGVSRNPTGGERVVLRRNSLADGQAGPGDLVVLPTPPRAPSLRVPKPYTPKP